MNFTLSILPFQVEGDDTDANVEVASRHVGLMAQAMTCADKRMLGVTVMLHLYGVDVESTLNESGSSFVIKSQGVTSTFQVYPMIEGDEPVGQVTIPSHIGSHLTFFPKQVVPQGLDWRDPKATIATILADDNYIYPNEGMADKYLRITKLAVKAFEGSIESDEAESAIRFFYSDLMAKKFLNLLEVMLAGPYVDMSHEENLQELIMGSSCTVSVTYLSSALPTKVKQQVIEATNSSQDLQSMVSKLNLLDDLLVTTNVDGAGGADVTLSNPYSNIALFRMNVKEHTHEEIDEDDEDDNKTCAAIAALSDDACSTRFSL